MCVLCYVHAVTPMCHCFGSTQVLASQQWTEKFVSALASMNPPNVGVVGPAHTGGNTRILTYDFTSRKVHALYATADSVFCLNTLCGCRVTNVLTTFPRSPACGDIRIPLPAGIPVLVGGRLDHVGVQPRAHEGTGSATHNWLSACLAALAALCHRVTAAPLSNV